MTKLLAPYNSGCLGSTCWGYKVGKNSTISLLGVAAEVCMHAIGVICRDVPVEEGTQRKFRTTRPWYESTTHLLELDHPVLGASAPIIDRGERQRYLDEEDQASSSDNYFSTKQRGQGY